MRLTLAAPRGFKLATVAQSHGWYDLAPFAWHAPVLSTVVTLDGVVHDVSITQSRRELVVDATPGDRALAATVASMLRLDEDLAPLYALTDGEPRMAYARRLGAGRLLRAPTAFEDVIKILLTTNCTWTLTRLMVTRLVHELGVPAPSGRRAFPTAEAMARKDERFHRDVVKAGYRAPHLAEIARAVAAGELDPEAWREHASADSDADSDADTRDAQRGPGSTDGISRTAQRKRASTDDSSLESRDEHLRKELLELPGIGPYAADNLLRLLGHYAYLGLDSWCRGRIKKLYPRTRDVDKFAARRYRPFGKFAGLAMWIDLTAEWHTDKPPEL